MGRESKLWGKYSHPDRKAPYVPNNPSIIYGPPARSGEDFEKETLESINNLGTLQADDVILCTLSPATWPKFQPSYEYGHLRGVYRAAPDEVEMELYALQPVVKEACKSEYHGQFVLTKDRQIKRVPPQRESNNPPARRISSASRQSISSPSIPSQSQVGTLPSSRRASTNSFRYERNQAPLAMSGTTPRLSRRIVKRLGHRPWQHREQSAVRK